MGVFDDKKFEELDWISQATEPIDSELNEYLEKLPDELTLDFDTYKKMLGSVYNLDLSIDSVIYYLLEEPANISYAHRDELKKCFKFVATGGPLLLNFETKTIDGGEIKLVKIATTLDEKTLENILGCEGIDAVQHMGWVEPAALSRMNEIMDLLGNCNAGLRTRSFRRKKGELMVRLKALFKANEWNIRDTELANKVGKWIATYIKDGNLASLSNFCRIKVMTHKGQPIYSMEEVL